MKYLLFVIILCIGLNDMYAQKPPKTYVAHRTIDSIIIDGKQDELSWKNASYSEDFIDIEGVKKPAHQTNVKMLWDDDNLYFFANMKEPHIWATLKQRDTVIFYNNDFEIFIDPDGDAQNYLEFEMNALNTVWDLFIVKPYREPSPIIDHWDFKGLRTAVHINGTLNDPSDIDKAWSVEVAIPWEAMEEANVFGNGHEEEFWRINFSRVNWDFQLEETTYSRKKDGSGKFLPEYNWVWSPQGVINMHEPEHWGYVFFSKNEVGDPEDFSIPGDEKIKWELFKLYRAQKQYMTSHGKWATEISQITAESYRINGNEVETKLENHSTGWNISILSPQTGITYFITEEGVLSRNLK